MYLYPCTAAQEFCIPLISPGHSHRETQSLSAWTPHLCTFTGSHPCTFAWGCWVGL